MKANRKFVNDRAEVGIGTLIVFIAMILVAGVAAAVLVNTSGVLQGRALGTGKAASDDAASNLKVIQVYGERAGTTGDLTTMKVYVQLAPGSLPINMSEVWIHYADEAADFEVAEGDTKSTTVFTVAFPREDGDNEVLENGEIARLEWTVAIGEGEHAKFSMNPDKGQATLVEFYAPTSFGTLTDVALY